MSRLQIEQNAVCAILYCRNYLFYRKIEQLQEFKRSVWSYRYFFLKSFSLEFLYAICM